MALELGWGEIPVFSNEALEALQKYAWPGNIRELKNVVERAVYRSDTATITDIDFHPFDSPYEDTAFPAAEEPPARETGGNDLGAILKLPLKEAVWQLKVTMMENALQKTKYNQKKAARFLGLTYHQFRGLYRQYRSDNRSNIK
jgi:psp operon transcriptional activator